MTWGMLYGIFVVYGCLWHWFSHKIISKPNDLDKNMGQLEKGAVDDPLRQLRLAADATTWAYFFPEVQWLCDLGKKQNYCPLSSRCHHWTVRVNAKPGFIEAQIYSSNLSICSVQLILGDGLLHNSTI